MKKIRCKTYLIHINNWEAINDYIAYGGYSSVFVVVDNNTLQYCIPLFEEKINIAHFKPFNPNKFFNSTGMDVTVTTPLEMNVGQQKYVVAYTLKQGTEKQPDILNAQKTETIDSVQKLGSPAAIRPDALFSSPSASAKRNSDSQHHQIMPSTSPPSSHGTLNYNHNDNSNKGFMALNQTIAGNSFNAQPPPYCSTMMNDFEVPLNYTTVNYNHNSTSGTSSNAQSYHQYNNLNNLFSGNNTATTTTSASGGNNLDNELLEKMRYDDEIRDYKYANGPVSNDHSSYHHYDAASAAAAGATGGAGGGVDYKNLANQIANTISNINSTLSRSRNRNHILTDNLPGPESCV